MKKPELLAPVGSKEALIAAIENGADAVYFGGSNFSARQYASNFINEELEFAIDYAHIQNVKAYVTVNTLIKNSELEKVYEYFEFLCNCGADAVIVQDIGILKFLCNEFPYLPIHASTQMTIHNLEGVKFLEELGVKRVVLARELSFLEIKNIKSNTLIEIETFIHGALCFSYSGQCILSSMIGGRSGNRGYCAQPCRKKYSLDNVNGYLLSPKDLNMSRHIGSLLDANIDSFKIEGRMKRPEYVAGVVKIYRNLIDRYFESPLKFKVTENEKQTLLQLFNRGFTSGYFFGNPQNELMSRNYSHNKGIFLGKVIDYDENKKLISINLKSELKIGDGIGIGEKDSGLIVRNIYINNRRTDIAKDSIVQIEYNNEVDIGDTVFKTYDSKLLSSLETKNIKKIQVKFLIKAKIGKPLLVVINDGEIEISGNIVKKAEKSPISKESIELQLKKLGNTVFEISKLEFEIDDDIFIPISELNSIRRDGILELEKAIVQKYKRKCKKPNISEVKILEQNQVLLSVNTDSTSGLKAAISGGADIVYIGGETFGKKLELKDYIFAIEYGRKKGVKVFIGTPRIIKDMEKIKELIALSPDGFLVSNISYLKMMENIPIVIDYPFNIFNNLSAEYLLNFGLRVTLSPELNLNEIEKIAKSYSSECIVHGLFPLMTSEHSLIKCLFPNKNSGVLKDEKGFSFPIMTDTDGRSYIMNSRKLCMLDYIPELINSGINCFRIEAKTFDADKIKMITQKYRKAIDEKIKISECSDSEYTSGHYFRGVL